MLLTPFQVELLSVFTQRGEMTQHMVKLARQRELTKEDKATLKWLVEQGLLLRQGSGPYSLSLEGFWALLWGHFTLGEQSPVHFHNAYFRTDAFNYYGAILKAGKAAQLPPQVRFADMASLFESPLAPLVFGYLPASIQLWMLSCWSVNEFDMGASVYPWDELVEEADSPQLAGQLRYMRYEQDALLADEHYPATLAASELILLLAKPPADMVLAQALVDCLTQWRVRTGSKGFFPGGLSLIWLGLLTLADQELAASWGKKCLTWARKQQPGLVADLQQLVQTQVNGSRIVDHMAPILTLPANHHIPWGRIWVDLCTIHRQGDEGPALAALRRLQLDDFFAQSSEHLLMELTQGLLGYLLDRAPCSPVFGCLSKPARWQGWLAKLAPTATPAQERTVWQLNDECREVVCRVQKVSAKGGWTSGRMVDAWSIQQLPVETLEEVDLRIARQLLSHGYGSQPDLTVLRLLAEHPRLQNLQGQPLSLVFNSPLVTLDVCDSGLQMALYPEIALTGRQDFHTTRLAADLWQIDYLPQAVLTLLSHLEQAPALPDEALVPLEQALNAQPALDWHSDHPALKSQTRLDPWPGEACVQLDWRGEQLSVALVSLPEVGGSMALPLGAGPVCLKDWREPHHYWRRDLAAEQAQADSVKSMLQLEGEAPWHLAGGLALALLERLPEAVEALGVRLRWHADSQRLQIADDEALDLRISQQQDWFSVEGELRLDQRQVLDLRLLLRQLQPGQRYIELDDQQRLLLSERLTQRLATLGALLDDKQQIRAQLAYPLARLLEHSQVAGDEGWEQLAGEWQQTAPVPESLLAPLRDYQKQGVQWLANLALHGFGACLADDMGLGKTIQALTVLRLRKSGGPALVVVPKSLLANWQEEAERFAPELKVCVLNEQQDRGASLENLGAGDLVLTTYGLLPGEPQLLSREWATLVADEAQQIKNANTARAKALFELKGQCRLALSGTPVENHLGELWSLFNFINPGLFGNKSRFSQRFGKANRDPAHLAQLRAVISPFVLRRLKSQVLTELPEKTEVLHHVTLSKAEQALYEASRQEAVAAMQSPEGGGLMALLSRLTRLRRLCCSPALVVDDWEKEQSKLEAGMELITDAIENGHRILVFSQFVDLLTLLRTRLEAAGYDYCYLDGSLTAARRNKAIQRFKRESVPLFLISLKAGGTGLNLTEADTVIHLDPWWNPAVEDQASDRVHRIGQTQPVTVYRLVCEHTVEEKIVALHQEKRALADGLLCEQGDVVGLDAELLRGLLCG